MIGDKLRERRLELQMTQAQLASLTNIKKNTISNYENNISSPNEDNILKLMNALKCDANYLFEWSSHREINLTFAEQESIKKYRTLDGHGKKIVDVVLEEEYRRISIPKIKSFRAAHSVDNHEPEIVEMEDLSQYPESDIDGI